MTEAVRGGWKKFGYFCLAWVPLLLYAAITLGIALIMQTLFMVLGTVRGVEDIFSYVMDKSMMIGAVYGAVGIVALGLWYYFGCRRRQLRAPEGVLNPVNLLIIAAMGICMQYICSYLMTGMDALLPQAMDIYEELIESSGLNKITVFTVLYSGIIAPIVEELAFRGVTLYYFEKFTKRFWLANVLQALAFGIMHMNLVQGTYAFVLGMMLGWVYREFKSLYASIWFHMFFNFLGLGLINFIHYFLPESLIFQIFWGILMVVLTVLLMKILKKRSSHPKVSSSI